MLGGGWGTAYIVWGLCQQLFIPKMTFIDIMTFSRQAKWTKLGWEREAILTVPKRTSFYFNEEFLQ